MATKSFNKTFNITNAKVIRRLEADLQKEHVVVVDNRDIKADSKRGIELLKNCLSAYKKQ